VFLKNVVAINTHQIYRGLGTTRASEERRLLTVHEALNSARTFDVDPAILLPALVTSSPLTT